MRGSITELIKQPITQIGNMSKKIAFLVFFAAGVASQARGQEKIDVPKPIIEYVAEHEKIKDDLLKWYSELISADNLAAVAAIDRLRDKKAFIILSAGAEKALPEVSNAIIETLLTCPDGNKPVIKALSRYLLAVGPPILNGGEDLTGQQLRKEKLIKGISRMAGVSSADVDINSEESITAFVTKVDEKIGE